MEGPRTWSHRCCLRGSLVKPVARYCLKVKHTTIRSSLRNNLTQRVMHYRSVTVVTESCRSASAYCDSRSSVMRSDVNTPWRASIRKTGLPLFLELSESYEYTGSAICRYSLNVYYWNLQKISLTLSILQFSTETRDFVI
jgi:hypothetical protein